MLCGNKHINSCHLLHNLQVVSFINYKHNIWWSLLLNVIRNLEAERSHRASYHTVLYTVKGQSYLGKFVQTGSHSEQRFDSHPDLMELDLLSGKCDCTDTSAAAILEKRIMHPEWSSRWDVEAKFV